MDKKISFITVSICILIGFLFALYGSDLLQIIYPINIHTPVLRLLWIYGWWLVPLILVSGQLYGFKFIPRELGLSANPISGFLFAALAVAPMFVHSACTGVPDQSLTTITFLHRTFIAGFMEELLFRGFLFGLLFRRAGWGFIPAAGLGAAIFGVSHLYQGHALADSLGIFLITFSGAAWFAWLFAEWENNLWLIFFLHSLMNLSWILFDVSANALGGLYANIFRGITIALSIIITIRYKKWKGLPFYITRSALLVHRYTGR